MSSVDNLLQQVLDNVPYTIKKDLLGDFTPENVCGKPARMIVSGDTVTLWFDKVADIDVAIKHVAIRNSEYSDYFWLGNEDYVLYGSDFTLDKYDAARNIFYISNSTWKVAEDVLLPERVIFKKDLFAMNIAPCDMFMMKREDYIGFVSTLGTYFKIDAKSVTIANDKIKDNVWYKCIVSNSMDTGCKVEIIFSDIPTVKEYIKSFK